MLRPRSPRNTAANHSSAFRKPIPWRGACRDHTPCLTAVSRVRAQTDTASAVNALSNASVEPLAWDVSPVYVRVGQRLGPIGDPLQEDAFLTEVEIGLEHELVPEMA